MKIVEIVNVSLEQPELDEMFLADTEHVGDGEDELIEEEVLLKLI